MNYTKHMQYNLSNKCVYVCVLDIFSQVSDAHGAMVMSKFDEFLREVLKLPAAVFEGPSFGYMDHFARSCFPQQVTISNTFLTFFHLGSPEIVNDHVWG